jgi:hypothetical protein
MLRLGSEIRLNDIRVAKAGDRVRFICWDKGLVKVEVRDAFTMSIQPCLIDNHEDLLSLNPSYFHLEAMAREYGHEISALWFSRYATPGLGDRLTTWIEMFGDAPISAAEAFQQALQPIHTTVVEDGINGYAKEINIRSNWMNYSRDLDCFEFYLATYAKKVTEATA